MTPDGMSGGTASGLNAYIMETSPATIDSLYEVMTAVAIWVRASAGTFLGHVKMSVSTGEFGSATLNLTDLGEGVRFRGSMVFPLQADIKFMAAVLDVDTDELSGVMEEELTTRGFTVRKNRQMVTIG